MAYNFSLDKLFDLILTSVRVAIKPALGQGIRRQPGVNSEVP
jgi:hypothetical protein